MLTKNTKKIITPLSRYVFSRAKFRLDRFRLSVSSRTNTQHVPSMLSRQQLRNLPRLSRSLASSSSQGAKVAAAPASSSSLVADHEAAQPSKWKGTNTDGGEFKYYFNVDQLHSYWQKPRSPRVGNTTNLIGGEWTTGSDVQSWIDVNDPSTQRLLTRVPETSHKEMVRIVDRAEEAFFEWRDTSVLRRQGVMLSWAIEYSNYFEARRESWHHFALVGCKLSLGNTMMILLARLFSSKVKPSPTLKVMFYEDSK